jgi:hypothetical protein
MHRKVALTSHDPVSEWSFSWCLAAGIISWILMVFDGLWWCLMVFVVEYSMFDKLDMICGCVWEFQQATG